MPADTLLGTASDACDPKVFNSLMIEATPYVEQGIANYLQKNPTAQMWASKIVTTEPFMDGVGLLMTKYVFHDSPAPQVPTNQLFKPLRTSSAGSGSNPLDPDYVAANDACAVNCQSVSYGIQAKQWSLKRACLNTAWLCALDIQFNEQFSEVLDAQARNLARISLGVKANWNRDTTIEFSQIVPAFPDFVDVINPLEPRGVLPQIPADGICKPHIAYFDELYDAFALQYPDAAVGSYNGMPLFGAIASRSLIFSMRADDPNLKELDKYGDPTFYKDGFTNAYMFHGWAYYFDAEAPRFQEDANRPGYLERVYPYVETATTIGSRYDSLPGGPYHKAPYEMVIVLFKDQFTNVPFRLNSRPGGDVAFKDTDYTGQVKWQVIPECDNEDQNQGRYRMQYIMGAKPGTHDAGFAFVFARPDLTDRRRLMCQDAGLCSPCDATQPTIPAESDITCAVVDGEPNQLTLTRTNLVGDPGPADGDTVWVQFQDGSYKSAEVISYTAGSPDSGVFEFDEAVTCDFRGGVEEVSLTVPGVAIECRYVGTNDAEDHSMIGVVVSGALALPDTAVNTSYTITFGNGSTQSMTYEGSRTENGETIHLFEKSSLVSGLDDCTSFDGAVLATLA